MMKYRDVQMEAPEAEPLPFWSSDTEEADPAAWLASIGGSGDGESSGENYAWLQPAPDAGGEETPAPPAEEEPA